MIYIQAEDGRGFRIADDVTFILDIDRLEEVQAEIWYVALILPGVGRFSIAEYPTEDGCRSAVRHILRRASKSESSGMPLYVAVDAPNDSEPK